MKLKLIFILILLLGLKASAQVGNSNFFLEYFDNINPPFNTNNYNKYIDKVLPYDLSLKHIFKGNVKSSKYDYEIYSDDDNTLTESGTKEFKIRPLNKYRLNTSYIISYYKGGIVGKNGCYIALLDSNLIQSDSLLVYQEDNENEFNIWTRSIIFKDSIMAFTYKLITSKTKEEGFVTQIIIDKYFIDTTKKKFILVNSENIYSKYYVYEFFEKIKTKEEDPFYKY